MDKREQSRQQWEQEIMERQHNVTPAEQLRTAHHVAKSGAGAPIVNFAHLARLVLGAALLALALRFFSSGSPYSTALGVVALAAGCYLGFTGLRSKHE